MGFVVVALLEAGLSDTAVYAVASVLATGVIQQIATIAVIYGAEKLLSPRQKTASITANNQLIRNSSANRVLAYGRTSVGGNVIYINQSGGQNQYLDLVFTLTTHEIDAIESIVLDNWALGFDGTGLNGGGACTGETDVRTGAGSTRFAGLVFAEFHLGTPGEAADAALITNSGGQWLSTDTVSGCAYVYLRLVWDQNTFSAGIPNVYCVIRGKKLVDPRTAISVTGNTTATSTAMTVASTSGISAGMKVMGPGIPDDTFVVSVGTGSIVISKPAIL